VRAVAVGYDLHITRRADWADDGGPPITEEEWLRLVEADPELRLDPDNGPQHALWSGPPEDPEPWLAWEERGEIFTKNPDAPLIRKMIQVAERLGAKVQGDDGDIYDEAHPTGWRRRDDRVYRP
jgi:hypothetical protein